MNSLNTNYKSKNILVRAYLAKNLGDDLFIKILLDRYKETMFTIIAPKEYNYIFKEYNNVNIIEPPIFDLPNKLINRVIRSFSENKFENNYLKLWEKYISKLDNIDGYIFIGGSIFMQSNKKEISLYDKLNLLITQKIKTRNKYILGANFGPFTSNEFKNFYHNLFVKYSDVSFRDSESAKEFLDLNNVRYNPDIVFQLQCHTKVEKKLNVGFSLIDLSDRIELSIYKESYLKKIHLLINSYFEKGYQIYLFSFCKTQGDENCINEIINRLSYNIIQKVNIIPYHGNIKEFLDIYKEQEIMYCTRFHSMILSLLFNHKIYPIIYSNKTTNVLNDLGFNGKYIEIQDIEHLDIDNLKDNVTEPQLDIKHLAECSKKHFDKLDLILRG